MCYFEQKLFIHATAELKTAVDLDPSDYTSMYNIACIYSLQNKPEPALKWLERAIDNGFSDFEHMGQDHDLDNIRENPKYIELVENAASNVSAVDGQPVSPGGTAAE
jgi:tetratricopeptide (TPR) repeat protein